jgi:hypothetical protein
MRNFFKDLPEVRRESPESVAIAYAKFLLSDSLTRGEVALRDEWSHSRRRYSVGLSARRTDFADLTKRVALVSDTLLLSHDWRTPYRRLGVTHSEARAEVFGGNLMVGDIVPGEARTTEYGFHCPDLAMLGRWVIDAEPLLKSGLAWYLPSFSTSVRAGRQGRRVQPRRHMKAIDFLIRDGRAVDVSANQPVENEVVRPILQIDLPFIQGVGLREFSQITVGEFDSYSSFRDFMRKELLLADGAVNSVQSAKSLAVLSLEIADQVRAMRFRMEEAKTKRAVATTGAVVGTVGAALVAVYGPVLEQVLAIIGGGGGLWGILSSRTAENGLRRIRKDKWYYVWVLEKARERS